MEKLLESPKQYLKTVDDFYHAYLIDLNAKSYGFEVTTQLKAAVDS